MKEPLVSIILPNFNHADFLTQRIESILNQTYRRFELIVLDDHSRDGSLAVFTKYKDRIDRLILNDNNSGSPFHQWQKGIAEATGEWIWIAESDDFCEPNFLEQLLKLESKADIRYCQSTDVDTEGRKIIDRLETTQCFENNIWESNFEMTGKAFCLKYLKVKNVIPNASAVIFRKKLIQPNVFTEDLLQMKMCGDWLFWIRILENAYIGFCAQHLNYFRTHPHTSRTHKGFEKIAFRLLEESKVRFELGKIEGLDQGVELKLLQANWYAIHRIGELFSDRFNTINMDGLYSNFKLHFIAAKFKKRLSKQ